MSVGPGFGVGPLAPRAVSFDVTGTLIHSPRRGAIYAEVLDRHGIDAPAEAVERLIRRVWEEMGCRVRLGEDRFATHPGAARGFWRRFLERLCEHLGAPVPSPFAAAELYDRFGRADAWELYPEVPGVLDELAARGLVRVAVANWDERLPLLLDRLGVGDRLEVVVWSQQVGVEKPHPAIFRRALERVDLPPPAVVHVGDRQREDAEGAAAIGMHSLLLDRDGGSGGLRDLGELLERLGG